MPSPIYCLTSGLPISEEVSEHLFQTACDVVARQGYRRKIKQDNVEGMIFTQYEWVNIAGTRGVLFDADIETETGHGKVKFFVRPVDLRTYKEENFKWLMLEEE